MANEIMVAKNFDLSNVEQGFTEEMQLLGEDFQFNTVIVPGGTSAAKFTDGDGEQTYDDITGIIVDSYPIRKRREDPKNPQSRIVCYSSDSVNGVSPETGEVCNCMTCPYAKKECRKRVKIFSLQNGNVVPLLISVPQGSIGRWTKYLTGQLMTNGLKPNQVVTKIGLIKVPNGPSGPYYEVTFTLVSKLDDATKAKMAKYSNDIKALTRKMAVAGGDEEEAPAKDLNDMNF